MSGVRECGQPCEYYRRKKRYDPLPNNTVLTDRRRLTVVVRD
jgi:hypothetical protein